MKNKTISVLIIVSVICLCGFMGAVYAGTYYVSVEGSGNHNGSSQENSLSFNEAVGYADAYTNEEIIFLLASGNYGDFIRTAMVERTAWITYKADTGAQPIFNRIELEHIVNNSIVTIDGFLRFDAIKVILPDLNYSSQVPAIVWFNGLSNVQIINCDISAEELYSVGAGVLFYGNGENNIARHLLVKDSHVHNTTAGLRFADAEDIEFRNNIVHHLASTMIGAAPGIAQNHVIIDKNSLYDMREHPEYKYYDQWGAGVHASTIAIRGYDYIITNNTIHDTRLGIQLYADDHGGESYNIHDIFVGYNYLYDVPFAFSMYNPGVITGPLVVKHNTFIGFQEDNWQEYNYYQRISQTFRLAFGGATIAYDGEGTIIRDNLFVQQAGIHRWDLPYENYDDETAKWKAINNFIYFVTTDPNTNRLDPSNFLVTREIPYGQLVDYLDNQVFVRSLYVKGHGLVCGPGSENGDFTPLAGNITSVMSSTGSYVGVFPPQGSDNKIPQVRAGWALEITLPNRATLDATVTDDGLPDPPCAVTVTWSKVSGPGNVEFSDPNAVDTTSAFSEAGRYILRLTADDGELREYDEITINVNPTTCLKGDVNQDGIVNLQDIDPFIAVISGADTDPEHIYAADINNDGAVDFADINPFIELLNSKGYQGRTLEEIQKNKTQGRQLARPALSLDRTTGKRQYKKTKKQPLNQLSVQKKRP